MPEITDEELQALNEKAASADALKEQLTQRQADVQQAQATAQQAEAAVATATETVRTALIASNPAIPEELIKGDTIEALNESVSTATAIANRLAEAAAAAPKGKLGFPIGAGSTRQTPNTEGMTPLQKVVHGIQHESDQHLA